MLSIDGEPAAPPLPAGEDQPGVLDRDEEVGAPAVVVVLLQPLEHRVGRVLGVHPDRQVEQREDPEDENRAEEPEAAEPGRFDRAPGEKRGQRDEDAEQPGVALAVAPGSRIHLYVVVVVMVMVMRVLCVRLHVLSSLSNVRFKSAYLTKVPALSATVTEALGLTPIMKGSGRRNWGRSARASRRRPGAGCDRLRDARDGRFAGRGRRRDGWFAGGDGAGTCAGGGMSASSSRNRRKVPRR